MALSFKIDLTDVNLKDTLKRMLSRPTHQQILLTFTLLVLCTSTYAAIFTVDDPGDDPDLIPGNGVCATAVAVCTLRAAVMEANVTGAGTHTINIPPNTYNLTAPGTDDTSDLGDLDVINTTSSITIQADSGQGGTAANVIIDGSGITNDRIFHILGTGTNTITLRNLTIRNASATIEGAGIYNALTIGAAQLIIDGVIFTNNDTSHATGGAGFFNNSATSTVTMSGVTIQNCEATNAAASGGGIYNSTSNTLTINSSSTINTNKSQVRGGAIFNDGSLTIDSSTINSNTSGAASLGGAGIANSTNGTLSITDSTLSSNIDSGTVGGGALANAGVATLTRTTIGQSNSAAVDGGGIANTLTLTLVNSTISGNTANRHGGGIASGGGTTELSNVTIANNTADNDGGGATLEDGGGIYIAAGTVTYYNTLIANNANNGGGDIDCSGPVTSSDYNLIEDVIGCTILGAPVNDLTGDPDLAALADNGGSTRTHALNSASIAIDAGNPNTPNGTGTNCEPTDQRDYLRPIDGNNDSTAECDIGAYEYGAAPAGIPISGGSCYIATAAYGTKMEKDVVTLRRFRDRYLLTNKPGQLFTNLYYKLSPPVASRISTSEMLREWARASLIPLVSLGRLLDDADAKDH